MILSPGALAHDHAQNDAVALRTQQLAEAGDDLLVGLALPLQGHHVGLESRLDSCCDFWIRSAAHSRQGIDFGFFAPSGLTLMSLSLRPRNRPTTLPLCGAGPEPVGGVAAVLSTPQIERPARQPYTNRVVAVICASPQRLRRRASHGDPIVQQPRGSASIFLLEGVSKPPVLALVRTGTGLVEPGANPPYDANSLGRWINVCYTIHYDPCPTQQ